MGGTVYIVTCMSVTTDGVGIDDRIYWTIWYSAWLHFTVQTHTHTLESTVTSSLPLLGSGFQRRTFPFLWVPEQSLASATSLNPRGYLTLTQSLTTLANSVTHQPTPLHWLTPLQWLLTNLCCHLLTLVPRSLIFLPWRWKRYVPPKRRFTQDLHGTTSQKTTFFIITAVKTSNLTKLIPMIRSKAPAVTLSSAPNKVQILTRYLIASWTSPSLKRNCTRRTSGNIENRRQNITYSLNVASFTTPSHLLSSLSLSLSSSRLMVFRKTIAVYSENRTEHTSTLCGQNAEI
jgi:hypothetical protein